MFATGETVGLAEWIIDDTYPVSIVFFRYFVMQQTLAILSFDFIQTYLNQPFATENKLKRNPKIIGIV